MLLYPDFYKATEALLQDAPADTTHVVQHENTRCADGNLEEIFYVRYHHYKEDRMSLSTRTARQVRDMSGTPIGYVLLNTHS